MSNVPKLADYLGKPFKCSCGRTHSTGLEGCTVGAGVLTSLVAVSYTHLRAPRDS